MGSRSSKLKGTSPGDGPSGSDESPGQQIKVDSGKTGQSVTGPSPELYTAIDGSLTAAFRENAEKVNAMVTLADTEEELIKSVAAWISGNGWKELVCEETRLRKMFLENGFPFPLSEKVTDSSEVAITGCESIIAQLGSVIVSSAQSGSRKIFIFPPVHIVVANSSQLSETLEDGYLKTILKYGDHLPSFISVITGPSRTADIEKTLVLGAHGPVQLHIFILNDSFSSK